MVHTSTCRLKPKLGAYPSLRTCSPSSAFPLSLAFRSQRQKGLGVHRTAVAALSHLRILARRFRRKLRLHHLRLPHLLAGHTGFLLPRRSWARPLWLGREVDERHNIVDG